MNAGKGGRVYPNCKSFKGDEMMQHVGLYILHGLAPSLQIKMKLQSIEQNEVNGNDLVCESLRRNAPQCHCEFKYFLLHWILHCQCLPECHFLIGRFPNTFNIQFEFQRNVYSLELIYPLVNR